MTASLGFGGFLPEFAVLASTGHALNKITKDIINRSKIIQGYRIQYDSPFPWFRSITDPPPPFSTRCSYVPGFDTHGLPLELKALAALKKPAAALSPQQIRAAARHEAEQGIELQKREFQSFAVVGDWANEYRTMDWKYEKRQLGVVKDMVSKGERDCFRFLSEMPCSAATRRRRVRSLGFAYALPEPELRFDRVAQPTNVVLAFVAHGARRGRARISRRSRLAFGLCQIPRRIARRRSGNSARGAQD